MMSGIKVNGLDQLNAKLRKNMDLNAVKTIVKKNGADLQKKAQHYVPVDTGTLKRSIGLNIKDGGLTAVVFPPKFTESNGITCAQHWASRNKFLKVT